MYNYLFIKLFNKHGGGGSWARVRLLLYEVMTWDWAFLPLKLWIWLEDHAVPEASFTLSTPLPAAFIQRLGIS